MPKVKEVATPVRGKNVVKVNTITKDPKQSFAKWWALPKNSAAATDAAGAMVTYLRTQQTARYRSASIYARLYGNQTIGNYFGWTNNMAKSSYQSVPVDRPTFNLVQACIDTQNSRLTQARPRPLFLTDGGNYRKRSMAKKLNQFCQGEFYRCDAYQMGEQVLRDAEMWGTGCVKVYEGPDKRVAVERTLAVDLLVDEVDAMFGNPTQISQLMLVDRARLADAFPKHRNAIMSAEAGKLDASGGSDSSIADQVLAWESWHLKSGPDAKDGRHIIGIAGVNLSDEEYKEDDFPIVFLHYAPRGLGFWAQGLAEQLMGTQAEINKLLMTSARALHLVGVPRIFLDEASKVVKAHFNNEIGSIVTFRGTRPEINVPQFVLPPEHYQQLQRLIDWGFQQSGVSMMAATSAKPAGLNSGEAIRNYDDLQTDRFNTLAKRYEQFYLDLADKVIMLAQTIAKRDGKYSTIYPGRYGISDIDFPNKNLKRDDYVLQCFPVSSLPKDPAGRLQRVTEMMQAGMIDMQEGRRLLEYPDLEQVDRLANAAEERIYKVLDEIVEDGEFTAPDPSFNLQLAYKICIQYQNLYAQTDLEEEKMAQLRAWGTQCQEAQQLGAMAAMGAPGAPGSPLAVPEPLPTSSMLPQAPTAAAA